MEDTMNPADELPFRVTVGIFWLANFIIRIVFQKKAMGAEVTLKTHEKHAVFFFRLFAFCYVLLLAYIFSSVLDGARFDLSPGIRWIVGVGFLLAYMILFTWTHMALGRNWSGLLEIHTDHHLIVSGPFKYIRHPMYASFILSGIGFLLLTANWLAGGLYLTVAVAMYLDRVEPEEQMMKVHFGADYIDYIKKTGRIFPRF
jgi:protein-S-isoprenylcysteine O-methyltransferase Ste14